MNKLRPTPYALRPHGGYTLIEALVAITIIVFSTVGPLTLAAKSLAESQYVRDQITAFYLAQEGLEVIHHIRDASGTGTGWLATVVTCSSIRSSRDLIKLDSVLNGTDFDVDARCLAPVTLDPSHPLELYYNNGIDAKDGVLYAPYDALAPARTYQDSKFRRVLTLTNSSSNLAEYRAKVTVTWKNGFNNREVVLEESLFNL